MDWTSFFIASLGAGRRFRLPLLAAAIVSLAGLLALLPSPEHDPAVVGAQVISTSTGTPSATPSPTNTRTSTRTPTSSPTTTLTSTPPARIGVVKSCGPLGSSGQFPPGSNLPCTITLKLPIPQDGLTLEDIIGGGGRSSNTSLIGPTLLDGTTNLGSPTPITDQLNRVVYDIALPALSAGTHTISYVWRLSDLGCYRSTTNEIHLNNAQGVTLSSGTSTISMLVNCNAPITVGTGTAASCTAAALSDALALAPAPPLSAKIVFDCGAAAHTITTSELHLAKNLTIDGGSKVTLSGGNANRVLNVAAGAEVELRSLTISDGRATNGGGILNAGTLTLKDSAVRNNTASGGSGDGGRGGGIDNRDTGTLTIKDSTISNNTASTTIMAGRARGGGIASTGTLSITDSSISQNTASGFATTNSQLAGSGGGIWTASPGTLTIKDSTISDNTARSGGGILNSSLGTTIKDSTIRNNTATTAGATGDRARGGGIYNLSSVPLRASLTIEDSTISLNAASASGIGNGGGIANEDSATLTVRHSTVNQNTATGSGGIGRGGGIETSSSTAGMSELLVENSSITSNTASGAGGGEGGGIASGGGGGAGSTLTVRSSTLSQNTASGSSGRGGGIFMSVAIGPVPGDPTADVQNTTITGNRASGTSFGEGGGFFKRGGSATFTNSTVTGNAATASSGTVRGGGIGSCPPLPTLTTTTVTGNTPDNVSPLSYVPPTLSDFCP